MIGVIVRERHPAEASTRVDRRQQVREVLGQIRTGIHDIGGVIADYPSVGARERERTGVIGTQTHDVVAGKSLCVVVGLAARAVPGRRLAAGGVSRGRIAASQVSGRGLAASEVSSRMLAAGVILGIVARTALEAGWKQRCHPG